MQFTKQDVENCEKLSRYLISELKLSAQDWLKIQPQMHWLAQLSQRLKEEIATASQPPVDVRSAVKTVKPKGKK